jgi:NAD dependent epimerase/dehydratase family enzyme
MLRLALGEMADELILGSQRVLPRRLVEAGYRFAFPDLGSALKDVFGSD